MDNIRIKRIYEDPSDEDGYRILVDRIWPRGVSKEDAKLYSWKKELGPTDELRKWFGHDPEKFVGFQQKYSAELEGKKEDLLEIRNLAKDGNVTLLYGARDTDHNQAVVLLNTLKKL